MTGIWATLRLLPRIAPGLFAVTLTVLLVTAALPTGFKLASGALVGTLPEAIGEGSGSDAANRLWWWLALVGVLYVGQQTIGTVLAGVSDALGRRFALHLRERVMHATVTPSGIAHLEDPALLDNISMAQGVASADINPRLVPEGLAMVGSRYAISLASAVLLARFRWWLPLALLVLYIAVMHRFRKEFKKNIDVVAGQARSLRRSTYFHDVAMKPDAAKETRVFGLGPWVEQRFRSNWLAAMVDAWRDRRRSWVLVTWVPPVFGLTSVVAFMVLGRAAVRGEITLGELTVYVQAVGGIGTMLNLSEQDLWITYGTPIVTAALDLDEATAVPQAHLIGELPAEGRPREAIRFEDVTFRYPGQEREVLSGLDLEIPVGRSLAVVGDNGAGKTTLVKLLARLYDPTGGRVTVDGIDLRELDPVAWQQRIGAIFQDFVRYQLTLADNVAFGGGDPEARQRAAAAAGLAELAARVGWDTVLSRQFSEGTDLSGGQWQRVALARALYAVRTGAGVLVLDEPTANLDVRAEAELYDRFLELTSGLTTILISHRFSTVRRADRIVVLSGGRVVEDGTHSELLAANGRYAAMFRLQASRFTDGAVI